MQSKLPSNSKQDAKNRALALLDRADCKEFLRDIEIEVREESKIDAHKIIRGYKSIAYSKITDVVTIHENYLQVRELQHLDEDTQFAIKELSMTNNGIKVVMHDKKGALDQLAKISGLIDSFESAIQTLAKFGIELNEDENGNWSVVNGSSST